MKYRTTLILLAAVLAMGLFIGFFERRTDSTGQREEQVRKALQVNPDNISYLLFETTNLLVECAKEEGQWMLLRPVRARADSGEIDRILSGLRDLPRGEVITPSEQKERGLAPAQYGLDVPRARITLGDNLRRRTILVGRNALLGGSVYIRDDAREDIVATPTNLLALIPTSPADVRDRALFRGGVEKARRLELSSGEGFVQAVKTDKGRWMLQQPIEGRAAPTVVQEILAVLFAMRVEEFVADTGASPVAYGLDDPAIKVSVGPGEKEGDTTLLIGDLCETNPARMYVKIKGSEAVFAAPTNALSILRVGADGLRDQRLMPVSAYDFSYFRAQQEERVIELGQKETNGWFVVQPKSWAADEEQVRGMLMVWAGASIIGFIDHAATNLAEWGLSEPSQVLRFSRKAPSAGPPRTQAAGEDEFTVLVSSRKPEGGRVIVKLEHEDTLYEILADTLSVVPYDPLHYRNREVLNLDADDVMRITLSKDGKEKSVERSGEEVFLPVQEPVGVVDQDAIKDLLMTVSHLRAQWFVADDPEDLGKFGLDRPRAVLTLGLKGEAGISRAILFGSEEGPDGVHAMLRGQDVVFVLDAAVQKRLLQDLYVIPTSSGEEPVDLSTNRSAK